MVNHSVWLEGGVDVLEEVGNETEDLKMWKYLDEHKVEAGPKKAASPDEIKPAVLQNLMTELYYSTRIAVVKLGYTPLI